MYLKHHLPNLTMTFATTEWTGAVNMLLVGDSLAIIQRSQEVPSHKGQLALLGGHRNKNELSPLETAQREFEEETGLDASEVAYHSYLPSVKTGRGNTIVPVLGRYQKSKEHFLEMAKSNGEWDDLLLVDVNYLSNIDNWQKAKTNYRTGNLYFVPILPDVYDSQKNSENHILWGATAKIIWYFFKF